MRARLAAAVTESWYGLLVGVTTAIGTAAVLFIGGQAVRAGQLHPGGIQPLTVGDLLLVMSYLVQIYEPLKTIGKQLTGQQKSMVSVERAFALLDEAPGVAERPNARPIDRAAGEVVFDDVSFSYEADQPILAHVTFHVPPGSRVGVSGRTGAGKTTMINLLNRFYDPTAGSILLDGVDLRDCRLADLRRQFAVVLQEPVLFSTSIAENIAYARPGATESEIEDAARMADAHTFISRLTDGYQTKVGERGMRLSGGERQRISLARAFLRNAPILILDEPTSSIDVRTEATIMEAIERLMHGRTTFMIAHRLSTLSKCDIRIELDQNQPVQVLAVAADAAEGRELHV
jgi:ATP-binding cassette subfamily B protein